MPKYEKRFDPHDHLVSQGWKGKGTGESLSGVARHNLSMISG